MLELLNKPYNYLNHKGVNLCELVDLKVFTWRCQGQNSFLQLELIQMVN
jgi:hypothetical protein